jgi:hypothetical protein
LRKEKWQVIPGHRSAYGEKYAISNNGRLVKFKEKINDGSLLKCSLQEGYPIWRTKKNGKHYHVLIHRLVAKYFLPKPQRGETIVIHSNFKKADNRYYNLQWTTPEEAYAHQQGSPAVKRLKRERRKNPHLYNARLTVADVRKIRSLLSQNKTLKEIALKFGISDMQVHRIKTGENWSLIK